MKVDWTEYIPDLIADKSQKTQVTYGEYIIDLPKPPPLSQYENYGKFDGDQLFVKTPKLKGLEKMSRSAQERIVREEMRKRKEGIYILINGFPIWITGKHYYYLNYWTLETGGSPDFTIHDVLFFYFWEMCEADPDCYGMFDIKPRRVGDTEKALCILYEYASRVKRKRVYMQNKTDTDAFDNYMRLINSHQEMQEFFKPINQGSTEPKRGLIFKRPAKMNTAKSLREQTNEVEEDTEVEEVGSFIKYRASREKSLDGKRVERYHLDEPGKMGPEDMNPIECWNIVRPCLHLHNGAKIIGKALLTSTIEYLESGVSLEYAKELWDASNPKRRNDNNRTRNGLYRIFRNAAVCGEYDKFGFPKLQQNIQRIVNTYNDLIKQGKIREASDELRRTPLTIQHALAPVSGQAELPANQIKEGLLRLEAMEENPVVRGDLIWEKGPNSRVIWVANPEGGKFYASYIPKDINDTNKISKRIFNEVEMLCPMQPHKFVIGVDTFDHIATTDARRSNGAFTVFRKFDALIDGDINESDPEKLLLFKTNQFILDYCERPDDPDEFYEDVIKTAVFFGCEVFYENNKPGLGKYFKKRGYYKFLMQRPDELRTSYSQNQTEPGAPSTTGIITQYIEWLKGYIAKFGQICKHERILNDWLAFTSQKRTKFDLTVATGFTGLAVDKKYKIDDEDPDAEMESIDDWYRLTPLDNSDD